MEINKNDEIRIIIDGYTSEGLGVGRVGKFPIFVEGAVRGDYLLIKIVKLQKSFGYGKIMEILTPSDKRTEPICPHFKSCGGCAIMHMSEEERAFFKEDKVKNAFLKIGGIDVEVEKIAQDKETGYRNKIQMPVSEDYTQAMYKSRTNEKVSVPHCVIEDEESKKVIELILTYLKEKNIKPYNPLNKAGVVRHIYTRVSGKTGDILATVIAKEKIDLSPLVPSLKKAKVKGLVLNINKSDTNKILGDTQIKVFGDDFITDTLCGTDFDIYPDSFFQVNKYLTERLYNKAVKLADLSGKETVFDLYCGAGTITAALSKKAKKVIGVEIVPSAVKSAKESLKRAKITNAEIHLGEAETVAPRLIKEGERADVVVVDPPRKGCEESLLEAIAKMNPERIVYVSCDVSTLARDAKFLCGKGYELKKVYPFDMFPFTHHVETVCLLSKLNTKQHIEINLDMDELDLTDAEKKATYQEIKDYVLEHSGLKVSSLYIAQVKQKCGIIERENYNKPKSEDAKQPQCPPDKEKAIKEALTHFGMI